jgi:hypothetical protein
MKKAFRKTYDFAPQNPERYLIFLKEYFTRTSPTFYSVICQEQVDTIDGIMFALELAKDIENPDYDTIAECIINGETIYLWQDHCWGVGVDKNGEEVRSAFQSRRRRDWAKAITCKPVSSKQTILLFQIGIDPVE